MALFRTPPRANTAPNKGFLRTRRPKHRHTPWKARWMDANWYSERNDLRARFEELLSGEYSQAQVLNENWMTPTSWYEHKNELRDRFQNQFMDELN